MRIEVLGVSFHNVDLEEAVAQGRTWLQDNQFRTVVTPNPEFVFLAQKNPVFRAVLQKADLVLPDGIGVVYASKILGRPITTRVPGIDFAWGLLGELHKIQGRVFLLGAKEGIAQEAGERIARAFPNLTVCGSHHGYFTQEKEEEIAQLIAETKPDVIFACLGAPRQELFLSQWGEKTGAKIGIGLGGALDVFAGVVDRAPESWQKCHLEWLYRLKKEPKRLGRMVKLPLILVQATGERVLGKRDWCLEEES